MKKRKYSMLLNIAVLCLCVAAIAIGVYSAKNASLNVTGTIGFVAHDCKVEVYGKITGAVDSSNNTITANTGTATVIFEESEGTGKLVTENTNNSWNIGDIYFDDLNTSGDTIANDIVITLTLKNVSEFYDITATIIPNTPDIIVEDVTFSGGNYSGYVCVLSKDKTAITATITLKLYAEQNITAKNNFGIDLKFEKPQNVTAYTDMLTFTEDATKYQSTVKQKDSNISGECIIPSGYLGTDGNVYLVSGAGNTFQAFNSKFLTKVEIPYSFTEIYAYCFGGATSLKDVILPNSLRKFGNSAFQGCTSLTSINIPKGVTSIGNLSAGMPFDGCTNLENVTIPVTLDCIAGYSFSGTKFLNNLLVNNDVAICTRVDGKKFVLSVKKGLTSIDISSEENVIQIAEDAFSPCRDTLTSVKLPKTLPIITEFQFSPCGSTLETVDIPKSVVSIGDRAFQNSNNKLIINYEGTISEWNAISKHSNWKPTSYKFTVHCADGDLSV